MPDPNLEEMQRMIAAAFQTAGRELDNFHKKAKETVTPSGGVSQLNSLLAGMSRNLVGPLGVAAGFYAAGKAVIDFSDQRLKLKLFSTDVGFTADAIHGMRRAMFAAGKEYEDANRAVAAIGTSLKDLQARRYGAQIYDDLTKLGPGMREMANQLLALVDRGEFDQALRLIESKWKDFGPRTRTLVAQAFRVSPSDIDAAMEANSYHLDKKTQEIAERHAKQIRRYRSLFKDAWEYAMGGILDAAEGLSQDTKKIEDIYKRELGRQGFGSAPKPTGPEGEPGRTPETTPSWQQWLNERLPKNWTTPRATPQSFRSIDRQSGDWEFGSRNRVQAGLAAGLGVYQKGVDWLNDPSVPGLSEEKESLLQRLHRKIKPDVESALDQALPVNPLLFMKHAASMYSGGPTANFADRFTAIWGPGGAKNLTEIESDSNKLLRDIRDLLQRSEIDSAVTKGSPAGTYGIGARGGALQSGLGGFRAGGRGTRTGASGNFGGDDDAPVGTGKFDRSSFAEELKSNPDMRARLQTIVQGEVGHRASRVRQLVQLETIFNRARARGQTLDQATREYTGPGGDPLGYYPRATFIGGRIQSQEEYEAFQKRIMEPVLAGSDVSGETLGFPATGNASGGVAARGIRSGKYTRYKMLGPETYVQEGHRESIRRLEESRMRLDAAQSPSSKQVDANMNATIDFKNMPAWVKTAIDDNGKFKNLRVNRSTPQNGRAGSGLSDYNPWSYE